MNPPHTPAVRYRLRIAEPHRHLVEVEVHAPVGTGAAALDLVMPSWTPGSYLMREFPRNVQDFAAADDQNVPLAWAKTDKNTWRVQTGGAARVIARYRVHANELSVRTSHVDATHAAINGASVFMYVAGAEHAPLCVSVEAPQGWQTTTALPRQPDGTFTARDYDELVDSPLEIGTHALAEWEVDGTPHRYAVWGRGNLDIGRLVADTTRIVRAERDLFGGALPYPDFTFLVYLTGGGHGGLEHRNSTALLTDRWSFRGKEYETFLGLVAHELFHAWNGKRLRPAALGPFAYTRENYTRDLWVVEGFTTYYTDRVLLRAGIVTPKRYLEKVGEMISRHLAQPGRLHQTLADSSFDTWIKFYRPDAHTPNAQISYYQKGALVALLLDLRIRAATGGGRSLDDLLREMWARYGARDVGYPEGEVERVAAEVCGEDLRAFFDVALRSVEEMDFDTALTAAGLRLEPTPVGESTPPAAFVEVQLGLRLREEAGRLTAAHVLSAGAAEAAGVNAGDEILALDDLRVPNLAAFAARLREHAGGNETVPLAVFRRDELITLRLAVPGPPAGAGVRVVPADSATPEQRAVREGWLARADGVVAPTARAPIDAAAAAG